MFSPDCRDQDQRHPGPPAGELEAAADQHQLKLLRPRPPQTPMALRHQAGGVPCLPLTFFLP